MRVRLIYLALLCACLSLFFDEPDYFLAAKNISLSLKGNFYGHFLSYYFSKIKAVMACYCDPILLHFLESFYSV